MRFALKVALRYLGSNPLQSGLLLLGVALAVVAFVFITALIQGLALFLIAQTTGQISHINLEPPTRVARILVDGTTLTERPVSSGQRLQIRHWQRALAIIAREPDVIAARPIITGNVFLLRGEAAATVSVQGLRPDELDAISSISSKIIAGRARIGGGEILIGARLAEDLGLRLGRPVTLRSDRGGQRLFSIAGIYETGIGSLDERVAIMSLESAKPLFDLPTGVTAIEIKLSDPNLAVDLATQLGQQTDLKATPWQEKNRSLQSALTAQGRTGMLIQSFALISIIIGVSSALLLSSYRRRAEIGIMRSFGVSRGFVMVIFVAQGVMIGAIGAGLGCGLGFFFVSQLASIKDATGAQILPVAPFEGGYAAAFILTTLGAALASILPARAAASIDPLEAIQQ
jgi:lipoprotein-releasing system permease protein